MKLEAATEAPTILCRRDGRTATVTIHRPPLNILDIPTIALFGETLAELEREEDLQVVFVRGAGERAFSAGVSIQDHTRDKVGLMLRSLHDAMRRLRALPALTVAAVHGHCLGGGMELALTCDMVIATDDAAFGNPEIELGCYPPVGAALYPSLIGEGRALDLLLTGRKLTCEEAERLGLVTRRVPSGGLDEAVARLADEVTRFSAPVTRLTKRAVQASRNRGFDEALDEAERLYVEELCEVEDMTEGLQAFLEKRRPVWKHR